MTKADGIVTRWYILEVEDHRFLTGDVVEDRKGRWRPGDYMFSSVVVSLDLDVGTVHTRNSVYTLSGPGEVTQVSAEFALLMRQGRTFEEAQTLLALERPNAERWNVQNLQE